MSAAEWAPSKLFIGLIEAFSGDVQNVRTWKFDKPLFLRTNVFYIQKPENPIMKILLKTTLWKKYAFEALKQDQNGTAMNRIQVFLEERWLQEKPALAKIRKLRFNTI